MPTIFATAGEVVTLVDTAVVVPPPPPPPVARPVITRVPIDLKRIVLLVAQWDGVDRYDREQNHLVLTSNTISLQFKAIDQVAGGSRLPFTYPKYGWRVDGVERAKYVRTLTGPHTGLFTGLLGAEADGWHLGEIVAYDAGGALVTNSVESFVPFWFAIDRNGQAKNDPNVIVQTGSWGWSHDSYGVVAHVKIPKAFLKDRYSPLIPRAAVSFTTALPKSEITRVCLVPTVDSNNMDTNKPCVTSRGIVVTDNIQGYFIRDMFDPLPRLPQLDGARGTATAYYPLFARAGRNGKWYFHTPHALRVREASGYIRTLLGVRHKFARYWRDTPSQTSPEYETVGNWDQSIPPARRLLNESWGGGWLPSSLLLDLTAPLIGGEPPHLGPGPVYLAVDVFGRVLKAQFDGKIRAAPPVITELITGLADPWSLDIDANDVLYITERGSNRISEWNSDGTFRRYVIEDATASKYGKIDPGVDRRFKWAAGHTMSTARAATCLAPEGIQLFGPYLYWSALAQGEVRRIHLQTGVVEVVCRPQINLGESYFIQFCVNDNTLDADGNMPNGGFGPHGTVFTVNFDLAYYGRPEAFLPVPNATLTNSTKWDWAGFGYSVSQGRGGNNPNGWGNDVYPLMCQTGFGHLAVGGTLDGFNLHRQRDALDGPPVDRPRAIRGHNYYKSKSYQLIWGPYGDGYYDIPRPWGENADMDYWLTTNGHA